jgi:NADH-quinone oxidoreductase subunit E
VSAPTTANQLLEKYPQEVQAILDKYPPDQKRSAVMPLLYLAQRELGFITKRSLSDIGEITGVSTTDVAALVGYYTLYHERPGGVYRIQVCNDLPCALRGADEFLEKLCENLGIHVGATTPDGLLTIEAVMCLAGCHRAPLFQVQSGDGLAYYENQTVESAMQLVDGWRQSVDKARLAAHQAAIGAAERQAGPQAGVDGGSAAAGSETVGPKTGERERVDADGAAIFQVAAKGISQRTREERVRIQEEPGQ